MGPKIKKVVENESTLITTEIQAMESGDQHASVSLDRFIEAAKEAYADFTKDNSAKPKGIAFILIDEEGASASVEGQCTEAQLAASAITYIDSIDAAFPMFWQKIISFKLAGN